MTIMYYVSLSIYRIDHARGNLALFVTFATINAIYCSVWDLLMDWSLLQPQATKRFLRDVRGYKNPHYYYAAMFLDPVFRFNWIFYAIYIQDLQHSTLVSFFVAFSEVTRRGVWVLFRVENEHCANVARFKASRDVPLPYSISSDNEEDPSRSQQESPSSPEAQTTQISPTISRYRSHTGTTLEAQQSIGSSIRQRRPPVPRSFTRIVADAHTQDFEKKRKPGAGDSENVNNRKRDGEDDEGDGPPDSSDDDDDDDADTQDVLDAEALLRERREEGNSGFGSGGGQ